MTLGRPSYTWVAGKVELRGLRLHLAYFAVLPVVLTGRWLQISKNLDTMSLHAHMYDH